MMRIAIAVGLLAACQKNAPPGAAAGSGSASGGDVGSAKAMISSVDAALDAPIAVGPVIARAGVGRLGRFEWWKQDETASAALIEKALSDLPGITVRFDVMDVPGDVEREEGYWSVRRGDTELAQVLRQSGSGGDVPAAVVVWTKDIPTSAGIRVGDTVATLLAKHADLTCEQGATMVAELIASDLRCQSSGEPEITYLLNAQQQKKLALGKVSPAKLQTVDIVAIAHQPR